MIVLIGGEKGGTGKTTIATNLAQMRAARGRDVLLVDTDKQESASAWAGLRAEEGIEPTITAVQKLGKNITRDLLDLAKRYDDLVIDAGGRDSFELRAALVAAEQIFIPVQASQFDVWTLGNMAELVEQHIGSDLQYIRINGTIVGGLIGLVLFVISHASIIWGLVARS